MTPRDKPKAPPPKRPGFVVTSNAHDVPTF